MPRVNCAVCGGNGEITKKGKTVPCKNCRGRGWLNVSQEQLDNDPKPGEWE